MTTTASTSATSRCGPASVMVEVPAAGSDGWWRRFGGLRGRMLHMEKSITDGRKELSCDCLAVNHVGVRHLYVIPRDTRNL